MLLIRLTIASLLSISVAALEAHLCKLVPLCSLLRVSLRLGLALGLFPTQTRLGLLICSVCWMCILMKLLTTTRPARANYHPKVKTKQRDSLMDLRNQPCISAWTKLCSKADDTVLY